MDARRHAVDELTIGTVAATAERRELRRSDDLEPGGGSGEIQAAVTRGGDRRHVGLRTAGNGPHAVKESRTNRGRQVFAGAVRPRCCRRTRYQFEPRPHWRQKENNGTDYEETHELGLDP